MSNIKRRNHLKQVFVAGLGGLIGSSLRYSLSFICIACSSTFPIDTIIANLSGSFLLAFILAIVMDKSNVNKIILTFFTVGVIGSFTTFSTIMIDLASLINSSFTMTIYYLLLTILGGLTLTLAGLFIGKRI